MEAFDINITLGGRPQTLKVQPLEELVEENHHYQISYDDGKLLGTVWPDCINEGLCWFSSDLIAEDTLLKIGDAIERFES